MTLAPQLLTCSPGRACSRKRCGINRICHNLIHRNPTRFLKKIYPLRLKEAETGQIQDFDFPPIFTHRKQAEKSSDLETSAISYGKGRMSQRTEPRAGRSQSSNWQHVPGWTSGLLGTSDFTCSLLSHFLSRHVYLILCTSHHFTLDARGKDNLSSQLRAFKIKRNPFNGILPNDPYPLV